MRDMTDTTPQARGSLKLTRELIEQGWRVQERKPTLRSNVEGETFVRVSATRGDLALYAVWVYKGRAWRQGKVMLCQDGKWADVRTLGSLREKISEACQ